ncbi:Disks large 1 tumor suppressor protein [Ooceraea biroi]|uniref:Disks large 1 tumor suppressor protein n=1 Tax=Ooceraea biroi TaxID=2015173 RepID=A0A026W6E4_OOCBI|nr:Disks large 1 tumor suppressor protein [Ooceraea biroi]
MSDDGVSSSANTLFTLDTPGAAGPAASYCEVHGYVQAKEDTMRIPVLSRANITPFATSCRGRARWQGVTVSFDPDDLRPTYPDAGDIYSRVQRDLISVRETPRQRWMVIRLPFFSVADIQEFYELTLLDESKSVQQKTAETIRIADKWEASDGPITPTFAQNDVSTTVNLLYVGNTSFRISIHRGYKVNECGCCSRIHSRDRVRRNLCACQLWRTTGLYR